MGRYYTVEEGCWDCPFMVHRTKRPGFYCTHPDASGKLSAMTLPLKTGKTPRDCPLRDEPITIELEE